MEYQDEVIIDFVDLFFYLKKKLWIIILSCVVFALIGFTVSKFILTPTYTASTRVFVLSRSSEDSVVYADFQLSTQLLNDYKVLITGQNVTKEVIRELGLNMSTGTLSSMIRVSTPNDTTSRVLQISVTDTDPQRAADIANKVREVASSQLEDFMDLDAVKTVYDAEAPMSSSSPNVKRNVVLSALVGAIAAAGVLIVIYLLDDRIRTEEDVERYLGLGTLGVIPLSTELNAASGEAGKRRQSRGVRFGRKR